MSAPRWRWFLIAVWIAVCSVSFVAIDSLTARSWLLLVALIIVPPLMLLWLWNEDRPMLLGSLRGPKL